MKENTVAAFLPLLLTGTLLVGCVSNNDTSPEVHVGILTPAIEGISYTSGSESGVTDAKGQFNYEEGADVSFSIGNVVLGSITGGTEITLDQVASQEGYYSADRLKMWRLILAQRADPESFMPFSPLSITPVETLPTGPIDELTEDDLAGFLSGSALANAFLDFYQKRLYTQFSTGNHHTLAVDKNGRAFSFGEHYSGVIYGDESLGEGKYCDLVYRTKLGRPATSEMSPGVELSTEPSSSAVGEAEEACSLAFLNRKKEMDYNPTAEWLTNSENIDTRVISTDQADGLIVTTEGDLYVFGPNFSGGLGSGSLLPTEEPQKIELPNGEKAYFATSGSASSYVVTESGSVYSTGDNGNLQLAQSDDKDADLLVFTKIESLSNYVIVDLAIRDHHVYVLTQDGDVLSWGNNSRSDELATGNPNVDNHVPTLILANQDIIDVEAGADFGMAVDSKGVVWGWGNNKYGNLAYGTPVAGTAIYTALPEVIEQPTIIESLDPANIEGSKIVRLYGGSRNMHGLTDTGDVYSWGYKATGYFGNGYEYEVLSNGETDKIASTIPEKVALLDDVTVIGFSSNTISNFAVTDDNTVYAWGSTADGRLGVETDHCTAENQALSLEERGEGIDDTLCYTPFLWTYYPE